MQKVVCVQESCTARGAATTAKPTATSKTPA